MADSIHNDTPIDNERSKALIDSFLKKYPQYLCYLDDTYHVYPIRCEYVKDMVEVFENLKAFFSKDQLQDPVVKANVQSVSDLILSRKLDQMKKDLLEEIDRKTEGLNVRERRNYYLLLKKNLGKGYITEEVESYILDEFVSFRRIEMDSFWSKAQWEGIEMLRKYCKQELNYWKEIEPDVDGTAEDHIPVPDSVVRKVLLAYELGIIDALIKKYNLQSYSHAAKILEPVLDAKSSTLRRAIDDLYKNSEGRNNPAKRELNRDWVNSIMKKLRLKGLETNK